MIQFGDTVEASTRSPIERGDCDCAETTVESEDDAAEPDDNDAGTSEVFLSTRTRARSGELTSACSDSLAISLIVD